MKKAIIMLILLIMATNNVVSAHEEPKTYSGITEGEVISGSLSWYDVCSKCCGKSDGVTASGLIIQNGIEPETPVAACNWLPFGTLVEVDGVVYVIADRGGSGLDSIGRLDLFEPDGHGAALVNGVRDADVKIVSLP